MEYRTKSGRVLTDAMIEELAAQAERGDYPGKAGKMLVAPRARPPLCDEELVTVAFKIPRSFRDKLEQGSTREERVTVPIPARGTRGGTGLRKVRE